jgi:hypothetical protein
MVEKDKTAYDILNDITNNIDRNINTNNAGKTVDKIL